MSQRRLLPVLTALGRLGSDEAATWSSVCTVCAEVLAVDGAGIMLLPGHGRSLGATMLGASDEVAKALEEAQFTFGEGPCVDAVRDQLAVEVPDLHTERATAWTAFTEQAVELGVRAVLALPLRVGAARLGSLDLYRRHPGGLADDQFADALAVAELISHVLLAFQAHAPPGRLAEELGRREPIGHRAQVHQASGMVSAQLNISVSEALVRLRAHAYASGRLIEEVAAEVMDGTLQLDNQAE